MLPSTTILDDEDHLVGEGTSHRYSCTLADDDGTPILLAAITAITGWLAVHPSGDVINSRTNVPLLAANGGSLADAGAGVARFTWQLTPSDAVISTAGQDAGLVRERHRITLRFAYTKVGGGAGQLTKRVLYDVESFEDL